MDTVLIFMVFKQTNFMHDLLINVVSGIFLAVIVGAASTFVYPWWAHITYRPKLTLVDPRTGSSTISAIQNTKGEYEILFGIKNESYLPIKNISWHMAFILNYPLKDIQSEENAPITTSILLKDGRYLIKVDSNKKSEVDIRAKATLSNLWPLTISLSNPDNLPHEVYYYFSTDYGYIPNSIYKYENEFVLSEGRAPNLDYWAKSSIKIHK